MGLLVGAAPAFAQRPTWVLYDAALTSAPALERALADAGATVRYRSRWVNAISVDADAATVSRINKIPGVSKTRPVAAFRVSPPPSAPGASARSASAHSASAHSASALSVSASSPFTSASSSKTQFDSAFYGPNWRVIRDLGIPAAHQLGFTGRGIRIAILDTGFEPSHEALQHRLLSAQRDFINGDNTVTNQTGDPLQPEDPELHGTWVWSLMGGHAPGRIVGPAFDATFLLAKVETIQTGDEDPAADEDRWIAAVEWADSLGARIISSSVGFRFFSDKPDYQATTLGGDSALSTRVADEAARRGILIVNAVGNFGPGAITLVAPADGDSVLAVGAIDSTGQPAVFRDGRSSSRGPTADGRLKPELVAIGKGLFAASAASPTAYDRDLEGTDFTAPLIAGGAAMFMQAWPSLTPMAARTALLLSASRAHAPDNNVGYGVPNVASAILFPEGLQAIAVTGVTAGNVLTTLQPTFTWIAPLRHPSMPVTFRVEVATDPNFENIVYVDSVRDVTSLTVKRPLPAAPRLFWRVVAEAFPGVRRVTVAPTPFTMPDWVRLLEPEAGSFTTTTRPTFRWRSLEAPSPIGPLTYELQVLNAQTGTIVQRVANLTSDSVELPQPLIPNVSYRWRVIVASQVPGAVDTVESAGNFVVTTNEKPPATLLYQNFPNPFPRPDLGISETQFWFDVTIATKIEVAIYDLRGRLVRNLIPANPSCGEITLEPGQYGRAVVDTDPCIRTRWDARTNSGETVSRGVYILRLRAGGVDQIKRILYMPE